MSTTAEAVKSSIELQEFNRKCIKGSQVYLGAGGTGEWYHVIFKDEAEAKACAQQIYSDMICLAVPKVYPRDPIHHSRYPEGTYFFRVHHTAFPKFKKTYGVSEDVAVYGQEKPSAKAEASEASGKTCVIS